MPGLLFFPERVALIGILAYLTLWLLAPLQMAFPWSWGAMGYIALCYAAFWIGCLLAVGESLHLVSFCDRSRFSRTTFWTVVILGALGMSLRIYDKIFIRGIDLAQSSLESRDLLADSEAGIVAALGGALYPFCYVPLILWWARPASWQTSLVAKWAAVALFSFPALDALFLLSRSQMLVALGMLYIAAACVLCRGRLLHRSLLIPALSGLVALIAVSVLAFSTRLSQMGIDVVFSALHSVYGYALTPSPAAVDAMNSPHEWVARTASAAIPLLQYYLHGVFEFALLWDRPDQQVFTFGAQHFTPYVKALSIFGVTNYPDFGTDNVYFRVGVFTTFFGPLWVDFGWWGPLFMLGFGALAKICATRARHGTLAVIPLHSFFCVILLFMPVANFMISAQGMYVINAFALIWFFLASERDQRRKQGYLTRRALNIGILANSRIR